MKYALRDGSGKTVNIPDAFIDNAMRTLELTRQEAVELYLSDEGIEENEAVRVLTEKAKAAGTGAKATGEKKERKAPERKPDMIKRAIITALADFLETEIEMRDAEINKPHVPVEILNVERMIGFEFAGEKYEVTLTKKRKPKE